MTGVPSDEGRGDEGPGEVGGPALSVIFFACNVSRELGASWKDEVCTLFRREGGKKDFENSKKS